jgi:predicted Zn-dependent peptidase
MVEYMPSFRSVSLGIFVRTGARDESPAQSGISHFIEHMMFKGTSRMDTREIADAFDRLGGDYNAMTTREYTGYFFKVLRKNLATATHLLAQLFLDSTFPVDELDRERHVIQEEIAMIEDTPEEKVFDLMLSAAYAGHPLAQTILGEPDILDGLTRETLLNHVKQHYLAESTVISVAGNVTEDELLPLLTAAFASYGGSLIMTEDLEHPDSSGQMKTETPLHSTNQDHINLITDTARFFTSGERLFERKKTEQNHLYLVYPGLEYNHPLQKALTILTHAIGGASSSRLFQEIREKRGLAYSVSASHTDFSDTGIFMIYAGMSPEKSQQVYDVTLDILADIAAKGLTEEEVTRWKEYISGAMQMDLESTENFMAINAENELMHADHETIDAAAAGIEAVTPADIAAVTQLVLLTPPSLALVGKRIKGLV